MKKISIMALLCVLLAVMLIVCSCDGGDNTDSKPDSATGTVESNQDSTASKPADSKPEDTNPESKPADSKPEDTNPESKPADSKPEDTNPESKPADSKPEDTTPDSKPDEPAKSIDYVIKAIDCFGNKPSQSVVAEMFNNNDESIGMKPLKNGEVTFTLEAGEYYFSLVAMSGEFYYNEDDCYFTEDETERTITLYTKADTTNTQTIYVYDEKTLSDIPYKAIAITEGGTYVDITREEGSYFIFTPTRGGIYKFSYISERTLTFGYYGTPHNVLEQSISDVVDKSFEVEVKNEGVNIGNEGGTTQLVIGIGSKVVKNCVLVIERVGNATVELPFETVQVDKNAIKQDNLLTSEFVNFDITDSTLKVVYNEKDGFYHLGTENGPLIYIRISSALIKEVTEEETIYAYLPSFIAMCETDRLCKYFYEDGILVKKESYNDLFYGYEALCGSMGMYPLNKQLAEVVKNVGEHKGWFDLDGQTHIFGEDVSKIYQENAWLFACCYEVEDAFGTSEKPAPVPVTTAENKVTYAVTAHGGIDLVLRTISNATITISNAENIKIIANGGVEYTADENGKLVANIKANQNFTLVYEVEEETVTVHFTFVEYTGTFE